MRANFLPLLVTIILSVSVQVSCATQQERDVIKYLDRDLYIMERPLNGYLRSSDIPRFDPPRTSNWKGYTASWEIRDGKLYLTAFQAQVRKQPFPVSNLFPDRRLPIFASWYSGPLNIPTGERLGPGRPINPRFERLVTLQVSEGIVTSATERKNATYKNPE